MTLPRAMRPEFCWRLESQWCAFRVCGGRRSEVDETYGSPVVRWLDDEDGKGVVED